MTNRTTVLLRHVATVLAAAGAAALVFAVVHHALGLEVETAAVDEPRVTVASVLGTSSVAAALGWSSLAALERWTRRGVRTWTRLAVGVTALSLLGPLTTPDLTSGGRVLLTALHLLVGAITIGMLVGARDPQARGVVGPSAGQPVG
jgi:FtsH-binding integral membrane protein